MERISFSRIARWTDVFFAVVAVFLMYQIVQAAQRPSCTLFNDGPVTVSNGTATLAYTTQERPTSVRISPAVSGTPQLGEPDPERTDYLQMGQIATKAITKDTRFEMTVSNGAGSSKCSSTVYYKPMPSGGWDVPLVSQEPVFRRTDIPNGYDNSGGYYPFLGMQWIPGGYFVVNGNGNSTGVGSFHKTKPDKLESGGMYVFNENGSFLGVRDVVFDTTGKRTACFEGGGCTAGWVIHPTGQGRFVRDLQPGFGHVRSPVQYSVSSSGISLLNRLFFNQTAVNYGNEITGVSGVQQFSHIAIADGKMFGIGSRYDDLFDRGGEHALEIYDLNFTYLGKYSKPYVRPPGSVSGALPRTVPVFTPLVGIGSYILGVPDDKITHDWSGQALVKSSAPLNVYRAPTVQEIDNQTPIQKVQTIEAPSSGSATVRFAYDSANTNRIALFWGSSENQGTLDVYEAGTNGLQRIVRRPMTNPFFQTMAVGTQSGFAVSGEYVVYGTCSDRSGFDGGTGGKRFDSCEVVVEELESGDRLSVEPLPDADQFIYDLESLPRAQSPNSFAISPSGKILVSGLAESDWGNLYLYQIGGVSLPPGGVPPGGGVLPTDLTFSALLAENILRVMGDGSCPTQPTNTQAFETAYFRAVRGDSPVYVQDQFFSCVFNKALQGTYAQGTLPPTIDPPVIDPPESTYRVFLDKVADGTEALFTENTETGEVERLSKTFSYRSSVDPLFVISHDGQRVAYSVKNYDDDDKPVTLYSVPVSGGTSKQISRTADNFDVVRYLFSPDDRYLVYQSRVTTTVDGFIYSARSTGEGNRKISHPDEDQGFRTDWVISCDSKTVYYRNRHTNPDLQKAYSVAITGGTSTQLPSYELPNIQCD